MVEAVWITRLFILDEPAIGFATSPLALGACNFPEPDCPHLFGALIRFYSVFMHDFSLPSIYCTRIMSFQLPNLRSQWYQSCRHDIFGSVPERVSYHNTFLNNPNLMFWDGSKTKKEFVPEDLFQPIKILTLVAWFRF